MKVSKKNKTEKQQIRTQVEFEFSMESSNAYEENSTFFFFNWEGDLSQRRNNNHHHLNVGTWFWIHKTFSYNFPF